MSDRIAAQLARHHARVARAEEHAQHAAILHRTALEAGLELPSRLESLSPPRIKANWRDLIVNELVARDGCRCYLCHVELDQRRTAAIHIDHVIPESLGGEHLLRNLALACPNCNTLKADKIVAFYVSSGRPWYSLHAQLRD